jgi:hypothetical protein
MFKYLSMVALLSSVDPAHVSASSSFRYTAYLPASADCVSEISGISQRFEAQTGKKVTQQSCEIVTLPNLQRLSFHAATLIYQSDYALIQNPTMIGGTPAINTIEPASDNFGPYESYKSCVKDIPAQVELFETNLKMRPVATYCVPDTMSTSFMMRLDSFNSSLTRFHVLKAFSASATEVEVNAVAKMVTEDGGRVAKISKNLIYFYDETLSPLDWTAAHVKIKSTYVAVSYDAPECKNQKEKVKSLLSQAELSTVVLSCTQSVLGGVALEITGHMSNLYFSTPYAGNGYASYGECQQNLDRVVQEAKARSSRILGGICGFTGDGEMNNFGTTMISRNP